MIFRHRLVRYPEVWVLTAFALLTRLWNVVWPPSIVFDEIYFRTFAGDYLSGHYFFDIHPPLVKLIFAGIGTLFHLSADQMTSGAAGASILRVAPALAGAALVPLIYVILRQMHLGRRVAVLGAALVLLDNALLTESRFVLMDSMLLLTGFGAISTYLAFRHSRGKRQWALAVLMAVLLGVLVTTKWTGLAIGALISATWVIDGVAHRRKWLRMLGEAVITLAIVAVIYIGSFMIHFALLTDTGDGDAFMSDRFQSTLVGNPRYDPTVKMSFWEKFLELNGEMYSAQSSLNGKTHPYASRWYTWPFMFRPVYYWQGETTPTGAQENIYFMGNPAVWLISTVGFAVAAILWLCRSRLLNGRHNQVAFLLAGYALNFVPFAFITRPMFLYHYLFAYVLAILTTCIVLGSLFDWQTTRYGRVIAHRTFWLIIAIAGLGFLYFLPLSFGWPLSPTEIQQRMWFPSWR
jgi:dolichyl-phosphate-mannose-protein mannosyltransferase